MSLLRDQLRELVRREANPVHKFGHQVRLYRLSKLVGQDIDYNDDVVFAAVWLHDIGVFEGNRPSDPAELPAWDHVAYAVKRSREILPALGMPPEQVKAALTVIREHQPHDRPTSVEATIVRDADILEQLGSITILRTAAKLGSDTRFLDFHDVANQLRRQLRQLPNQLVLETSRVLAVPKIDMLDRFLLAYDREVSE